MVLMGSYYIGEGDYYIRNGSVGIYVTAVLVYT